MDESTERRKLSCRPVTLIEMPATDIARPGEFYRKVFGWNIRKRGDGSTSFDDTVGAVSGAWVLGRPRGASMVANGCAIVQPIEADAPELRRASATRVEMSSASTSIRRDFTRLRLSRFC